MLKEFKEFINRGNVVDMAVGVVLATAFGAVVNSVVNNILMPIIGYLLAGISFADLKIVLSAASADGTVPEVAIGYGALIQSVIVFICVAFFVFLLVKGMNKMKKKQAEAEEAAPAGPSDNELLSEILAELKKR